MYLEFELISMLFLGFGDRRWWCVCGLVGGGVQWGKATLMEKMYSFIFSPFIWKDKLYIVLQKWLFCLRSGFFWEVNSVTLPLCPHQHDLAVTWHIWKTEAVVKVSDLGSRRSKFLISLWSLNLFWIVLSFALWNAFGVWLLYGEVLWLQEWFLWIREEGHQHPISLVTEVCTPPHQEVQFSLIGS